MACNSNFLYIFPKYLVAQFILELQFGKFTLSQVDLISGKSTFKTWSFIKIYLHYDAHNESYFLSVEIPCFYPFKRM